MIWSNKQTKKYLSTSKLLVVAVAIAGCAFLVYNSRHIHLERGQYGVSDTYIGEDLADSLDLKLAGKASYPSSSIKIVRDLGDKGGVSRQIFSFSVKDDGLIEYGMLMKPSAPPPKNGYPALVLLHGYVTPSRYRTQEFNMNDMAYYASHGFLVVKPDYRGQGLSAKADHPDSGYFSMAYNTDVMSLISALKQTSYVDDSNLSLWGISLGSYVALRAAVLSGDIKNLILLSGPVDSLKKMYLTYIPTSDETNPYAVATRDQVFAKYGSPARNPAFWNDASPINFVKRLHCRVQIHVGLSDQVVSPEFSKDLSAALAKAEVPHQYFAYPGGEHNLSPQRSLIFQRSLALLKS